MAKLVGECGLCEGGRYVGGIKGERIVGEGKRG